MVRVTKTDALEILTVSGRTVTLASQSWSFSFRTPWFGGGASYYRPHSIEDGATRRRIHDYVMLARVAALAALAVTVLLRKAG